MVAKVEVAAETNQAASLLDKAHVYLLDQA